MTQLDELRQIIVGDNSEQIAELKNRIEDVEKRTHDVAEVLSPAIEKEVRSGNPSLSKSLQKPVSEGLKRAIRAEPEEYAEILYPVMAPSIRRAIAQAISSMMVTINRTIESATTVQGLSLRYQAIRTGVPYAELALRRTLLYRVEHVYLIHRDTGVPISTVHANDTGFLDSDAVSGMFSAIQSFVQDSFSVDDSSRLTNLKVGDHNVWVVHGANAMLACVIRGDAPESLKTELNDALDGIRSHYGNEIISFDGDVSVFSGVDSHLSPLLLSELKTSEALGVTPGNLGASLFKVGLFILLLLTGCYFAWQWWLARSDVNTVEYLLRNTPGIAATNVYWRDGTLVVQGLQDPDAKIPFNSLEQYGIDLNMIEFDTIPFRSLEVDMEIQRFEDELNLPSGVSLSEINGEIHLAGYAPIKWLLKNDLRIRQLAADRRLSIVALSASSASVTEMLNVFFKPQALQKLSWSVVKTSRAREVVIQGQMKAADLAIMKGLFANNNWIKIAVTEY